MIILILNFLFGCRHTIHTSSLYQITFRGNPLLHRNRCKHSLWCFSDEPLHTAQSFLAIAEQHCNVSFNNTEGLIHYAIGIMCTEKCTSEINIKTVSCSVLFSVFYTLLKKLVQTQFWAVMLGGHLIDTIQNWFTDQIKIV